MSSDKNSTQDKINAVLADAEKLHSLLMDLYDKKAQEDAEARAEELKNKTKLEQSAEQLKLTELRKNVKALIDEYNQFAKDSDIETSMGLLTKGGHNVYILCDGRNEDEEYFDEYDDTYNTYGANYGWFPSSLSC